MKKNGAISSQDFQNQQGVVMSNHDLSELSEHSLLKLAVVFYENAHPNEDALYAFAVAMQDGATKVSSIKARLVQCSTGKSFVGVDGWIRIESLLKKKIFTEWLRSRIGGKS